MRVATRSMNQRRLKLKCGVKPYGVKLPSGVHGLQDWAGDIRVYCEAVGFCTSGRAFCLKKGRFDSR